MASPIAETWIYTTMLIENEWGGKGTGFLVSRLIDENYGRIFLVTNKHVLNEEAEMRQSATWVRLYFNFKNADGSITGETTNLPLNLNDGAKRWREHPENDVDVLAFDVTILLEQYPQTKGKWADYSDFGDRSKREELDITIGEEALVIGYPLGLRHAKTNFPLVRGGIIATRIGENLEDEYKEKDGTIRKRLLRGFLIDGAVIPGSSGSPVVLKPTTGRFVKDKILLGLSPAILLGIVAETRYAPIRTPEGYIPSFAGLGLAFDAETVKETIELFFQ
jgi:S1-C subfamily serine protease